VTPEAPGAFCLVPARGGSRRIPRKNLVDVGGMPLVERAVRTAQAAFGRVFVSTDDAEIAAVAVAAGATVPALRPAALATATSGMDAVVHHAVDAWATDESVVVVVQPTSPFTEPADLRACVTALQGAGAPASALLGVALPRVHAFAVAERPDGLGEPLAPALFDLRSQDLPPLWLPTGGAFAAPIERLRAGGPLLASPMAVVPIPEARALDIDESADLAAARAALS
jgi:CMP-N-acetylneuraminic acid synthetase